MSSVVVRRSVRGKLLAAVLATTGCALLITGAAVAYYDLRSFRENLLNDLAAIADIVGLASAPALIFDDPAAAAEYLQLLQAKPGVTGAAIYANNGARFAEYTAREASVDFPRLSETDGHHIERGEMVLVKRIVADGEVLGTVYVRATYALVDRLIRYLGILGVVLLLSLAAAALMSDRLHRGLTGPISSVVNVARAVLEQRDFSLRAKKTSDDEIGVLVDAFNNMLDEVDHRNSVLEASNKRLEAEAAERQRVETALSSSERRNRTLVSAMAQVLWTADRSGRFVGAQPSWAEYTGQAPQQYLGFGWRAAVEEHDRAALDLAWANALEAPQPFELEVRLRHAASAAHRIASFRAVPIIEAGEVLEWIGAVTDIDDQRSAEEALRQLNAQLEQRVSARTAELQAANKELEGFSYSVSHDLRAPLRAVAGFANLLSADHGAHLDAEARRKIGIIQSEAARMGTLIDDLLSFSRLGRKSLQPTELDMTELARNVFERLQDGGRRVELRLGRLPRAHGDRTLLEQVWVNLLSNAIKFSANKDQPVVEIGSITDQAEYVYFVRDNGAGFDPRYQAKLFGVFQRLHDNSEFPGTGVGLALVQRIIARHGGRVWADGALGEGATFHFTLPKENAHGGV